MANRDKGRKKWGGFSQDNSNSKFEKDRSMGMRGGGNRAAQALYRPGSGPLRKSGRSSDDLDNENIPQEKSKPTSVQYRLKQSQQLNRSNQVHNSPPSSQIDNITEKLYDLNVNCRSNTNHEQAQSSSQNSNVGDARRRSKKPEQQLYVPKKIKEAMAEQDVGNRSPSRVALDRDIERENSEDRDSHSNRNHRTDGHRHRSGGRGSRDNESRNRGRDEHGKRYSGNRRNRPSHENEERWRSDSPFSTRGYGGRKDSSREVRQGSEPLYGSTNHINDYNRSRDTRSVEPVGYPERFQGKPPSGRQSNAKDSLPKNIKLEHLPPRLQRKYLLDNGLPLPTNSLGTSSEDTWNGSTVTFQGSSSYNYPPSMQHSQTMQNLPQSAPLPPQPNWSNTVPARSRGRGRLRPEELDGSANTYRCITPDQYSAPSSRSHTPSQEYVHSRSYDRRGSNSTMYTSMESLSRADSLLMPPPASVSPVRSTSNASKRQTSPDNHRQAASPPTTTDRTSHTQRANDDAQESSTTQEKKATEQTSTVSSTKSESTNTATKASSDIFDWYEEVELHEKLEAERASRSSSVLSQRENISTSSTQPVPDVSNKHRKRRRGDRRHGADRSNSRDKGRVNSCERQNNQQNRENDNYNNNQKNNNNNRRFENRRHRNNIQRSRESSKDRNYRSNSRNFDDLHRHRASDRYLEENWRTGKKMSLCDSDDGRQTPNVSSHSNPSSNATSSSLPAHQPSPSGYNNSQLPGVLVLPETSQSPPSQSAPRQQGGQPQRTLFDPNNPNKPIVVTSPGSRAAAQRENESSPQSSTIPVFQSHGGITSSPHSFQGAQLEGVPPTYMTHDQFGNMRPSWYEPYSERCGK